MWYIETARVSFRRRLTYRAAALAGVLTNLAFGLLRAYVFSAVARARGGSVEGYSVENLNAFTMLTQVLLSTLSVWSHVDLPQALKTGEIVTDYCKPVSLYSLYQAREVGRSFHDMLLRGLPIAIGYSFLMALSWPGSPTQWMAFALSCLLGWLVCYAWRFSVGCIAFWTLDIRGPGAILFTSAMLLMGFLVPLGFLPPWLRAFTYLTPFPSMVQVPIDVFLGRVNGPTLVSALAIQGAWASGAGILAAVILRMGEQRLVTQGG